MYDPQLSKCSTVMQSRFYCLCSGESIKVRPVSYQCQNSLIHFVVQQDISREYKDIPSPQNFFRNVSKYRNSKTKTVASVVEKDGGLVLGNVSNLELTRSSYTMLKWCLAALSLDFAGVGLYFYLYACKSACRSEIKVRRILQSIRFASTIIGELHVKKLQTTSVFYARRVKSNAYVNLELAVWN